MEFDCLEEHQLLLGGLHMHTQHGNCGLDIKFDDEAIFGIIGPNVDF